MDISTLYGALSTALSSATAINTWANTNYGKAHTIISRADQRNGPTEDNCPCCAITPISRDVSQENREQYNGFRIDAMVFDTSTNGFARLEAYRKLIEGVLASTAETYSLYLVDISCAYDMSESYPFLWVGMEVKFKTYITIGSNPLT